MIKRRQKIKQKKDQVFKENISTDYQQHLFKDLETNRSHLLKILGNSSDIIIREFQLGKIHSTKAIIIFMDGLVDKETVQHYLLNPLIDNVRGIELDESLQDAATLYQLIKYSITTAELSEIDHFKKLLEHLLTGDTVLLIDGINQGFAVGSKGASERNVETPTTQQVVRGPKDSFTENLNVNTALIRKRIKDPNLWLESFTYGRKTQTTVTIAYIHGIVNPDIVKEVKSRLEKIDIDSILESGYVEELIQDETYTPFPTIINSERPDAISAGLLEGRVAIIVDGTPFVLLVPSFFIDFFQSSEDYYQRSDIASLIRMLRFFAFFLALLTPSTYIALTTFHQEMIPTTLLVSLAAQREGIPFPALVEALIMEITFELLREAGIRLPNPVGSTISIVGALVLGQAAVDAGIVSATMVIVVSLTAISSFIFPNYNLAISVRMLRFGFMGLAATLGLFGIFIGLLLMALHLTSLRSFGIPYLSPFAPFNSADQQDAIIRLPRWKQTTRPRLMSQRNIKREKMKKPQPPNNS
ncbi:spore germination protein KA [Gracilibacillus orientalis]|uniref:Spore germination protein KA n=1 Tax=Gracilibacillus orientalis TaxID=334253 RepID=A0A1I4LML0_9BACI|nr:spore germination protein [Gracilibacillus orientalis]SFL92242.1 spore germination protein KA [Gracilibacillus orientalis]